MPIEKPRHAPEAITTEDILDIARDHGLPDLEDWPEWAIWCAMDPSGLWVFYESKPESGQFGRTPGGKWGRPTNGQIPSGGWHSMIFKRGA